VENGVANLDGGKHHERGRMWHACTWIKRALDVHESVLAEVETEGRLVDLGALINVVEEQQPVL
jgi:hypothetical protein